MFSGGLCPDSIAMLITLGPCSAGNLNHSREGLIWRNRGGEGFREVGGSGMSMTLFF